MEDTMLRAPQGFARRDAVWEGIKWERELYKVGGHDWTVASAYDAGGQFLGARTYDRGLGKLEFAVTSFSQAEAKAVFTRQGGIEYAAGKGSVFGAELQGNLSTGADLNAEGNLGFSRKDGVKVNFYGSAGASAALFRAQGEAKVPLLEAGPFSLKLKGGGELQALGLGASAGAGYRSFETRTGGEWFVSAGVTPLLIGGKVKVAVEWDWDPKWRWKP